MSKLSIQLYTLRDESEKNFEDVLRFCSEQGFEGVEFAGFYGQTKETIKEWLTKYNLTATSAHVQFADMEEDLVAVMEFQKFIGNNRIVVPYYLAKDAESTNSLIEKLRPISKILTENGFKLYYHNHDHELKDFEGTCAVEMLCREFSPEELKLEVDTFWVFAAHKSPTGFLEAHKDRIDDIVHIKDGFDGNNCTPEQKTMLPEEAFTRMTEMGITMCPSSIGLGDAPVADVIKKCQAMNIEWLVLENDFPYPDGFSDVKRSTAILKTLM